MNLSLWKRKLFSELENVVARGNVNDFLDLTPWKCKLFSETGTLGHNPYSKLPRHTSNEVFSKAHYHSECYKSIIETHYKPSLASSSNIILFCSLYFIWARTCLKSVSAASSRAACSSRAIAARSIGLPMCSFVMPATRTLLYCFLISGSFRDHLSVNSCSLVFLNFYLFLLLELSFISGLVNCRGDIMFGLDKHYAKFKTKTWARNPQMKHVSLTNIWMRRCWNI